MVLFLGELLQFTSERFINERHDEGYADDRFFVSNGKSVRIVMTIHISFCQEPNS